MAELLQWFHNLEPAERSSAMAIVDDRHFLSFYIDLMRHEHTERELSNSNSSALFMKDYLLTLYERSKAGKHYRSDQGSATFQEHTSNESSEDISSNHSALLLSFLNSDRLRGTDSSDFTDPFQLPCLLPGNSILKSNVTLSKLSATNDVCSRGSVKPFGDTTSSNLKLGLQSAITALFDTAVLNVVQKLGSQGQHSSATTGLVLPRATAAEPVLSDLLGHEINNKDISIELHKGIAVSFATGGSGGLDCLFFMRPLTEDSYKLVQMFSDLSNGRMFNQSPSKAQVKSAVSSRSLFLAGWLDDVLTTGSNKGSSAVPYYLLLLSRVELSMWSAYYSCSSNSINISGLGSVTDGYEDIPTANYKSVPLLPRSSKHDRRTAPSSVLPPIRNSLRVLERSALYFHASTSVMLTLGCIIEEQKLQWRSLSTENRLRILDCFPKAKAFYSNSENPRGRPESIVDRLILCPIDWIAAEAAVGAEADVVRAFRSLEAIAHSASNGYGSSSYSSSTILGGSSNEDSKNSLVRHPESKSLSHVDIMSGVSDGNRPVFIKFNKEAKRTGAVHILSEMSGNDSTSSTTGVEQIDRSVVTTRSTGTPLGLSARKRTQPTPTTPIPARHTAIVQSESSKVESSNEEEKIVVGTEEENQTAQVMAKATTSFKIKLDEDKDKDKRSDLDPIAVPAITPAAETSVMTASKIKRNKKKIKSIAQAAAKELSSMAENTISEEIIHASHIDASICADVSGGNRVSDSGRHMELEDVCVGSMSLSQKNEDNSPEFVELADTAMPFILRNGISSPVLDKAQQLQHPLGVIDSHPANQPDTVYSPPADIAINLLTDLQYAGDQAVASKIISASLSAEGDVLLDRQREESVQLVLSRNEKDSRQANYLEGDSTNLVLPTAGDSLPPDAAVHATGECSSHPEEVKVSLPAESLVVVSGSGVRVKSRELRIEVPLGLTVGNENEDLHPAITFGSFDSIEIKHTHPSAQLIPEGGVTPRSLVAVAVAVAGGPVNVTGSTIESTPSLSVKSIHSSYPASPVNPSALLARQLGRARAVTSIEDVSTERSGSINVLTDRDDRLPIRPPLPAALTRRLNRSYSQSSFAGEFTAPNVRGKPGSRFEAAENYVGDIRFVDEAVDHDFRCSSGSYSAFGDSNGNITDYPYNDSIQNIPDQRAGKSLRRTAAYRDGSSGSGRGVREQTEWKAKTALSRLQKILTRNIRSFNNIMSGRMEVHKLVRIALYLEVRSMVLSLWPSAAVRIFGSCITGLALPSSDIDLVIQLFRQQHYMPYQFQTQGQYQQGPVTQSPSRYQDPRISLKGQGQGQKHPQQELISPSSPLVQSSWQNDVDSSPRLEKDRTGEDSPRGRRKGKSFVFPPSPPGEVDSSDPSNHSPPLVFDVGDGSQSSFEFQQQYYPNPYARKQPQVSIGSPSRQPDTFLSQQMQELGMIPPPGPLPPSPEMFNSLFFALTSQLYMQIWASQVNPIPSATVPVIKMQVAADTLLANPAMQQAVYAVHRQQLHSPIVEPAVFMQHFVPPSLGPNANPNPTRNDTYPGTPQSYFVPPFPSLSLDAAGSVSRTGQNNAQTRDPGSSSRDATPSHSRHSTIDMTNDKQESVHPHPALSAAVESSAEGIYTQTQAHRGHHAQQLQQQQQQHQQHFSYPSTPFISSPGRIGERGHYMPPPHGTQPFMPPAPFAFLPFHMAAGVNIAVDITIEAGQHKGLSSCEFVQHCLSTRSAVLPAVVRVVKALLVQSKLNVPFTGGLSSYSAFILVLAAYDRCQYGEARLAACARRKSTGYVSPSQMFFPTGSDPEDSYAGSSNDGAGSVCAPIRTVSEGEVFLHFLSLYALSSSAFNPLTHGIDVRGGEPFMLSGLTPDQIATVVNGGLWIVDPLDPTKNVARPSFAFKQTQVYFRQCLDKIEGAAMMTSQGSDASSLDFLKLLIRYS